MGEGNVVECYKVLLQDLKERGALPKIARVPEEVVLPNDWTAAGMVAQLDRNQCDYVYLVNDLVHLEGQKCSSEAKSHQTVQGRIHLRIRRTNARTDSGVSPPPE